MNEKLFAILFLLISCASLSSCGSVYEDISDIDIKSHAENIHYEIKDGFNEIYADIKENFIEETIDADKEKDYPDLVFDSYTVKELYTEYEKNPMRALETYVDKHVMIVGKISEISPFGKYILVCAEDDLEGANYVYCHVNTDTVKEQLYNLSTGDMIVVKGKMGSMTVLKKYQMNVYEIQ